jgi:ferredoxin
MRVIVDSTRCQGHARCLGVAPEVFGYDDTTNLAFVLDGTDLEGRRDEVLLAVRGCPEEAITLLEDDV